MVSQTLSFALGKSGKTGKGLLCFLVLHAKENIAMLLQKADGDMKCDMIDDAMRNQKVVESAVERGEQGRVNQDEWAICDQWLPNDVRNIINFPLSDLNYLT